MDLAFSVTFLSFYLNLKLHILLLILSAYRISFNIKAGPQISVPPGSRPSQIACTVMTVHVTRTQTKIRARS